MRVNGNTTMRELQQILGGNQLAVTPTVNNNGYEAVLVCDGFHVRSGLQPTVAAAIRKAIQRREMHRAGTNR